MKVQFHHPRTIEGVHYAKGIHEVPEALRKHWFVVGQSKEGHIAILADDKSEPVDKKDEKSSKKEKSDSKE